MKILYKNGIVLTLCLLFVGNGCVSTVKKNDALEKDQPVVSIFDKDNSPRDFIPSPGQVLVSQTSNDKQWKAETVISDNDDQVLVITGPQTTAEFVGALPIGFSPTSKVLVFCYVPDSLSGLFVLPLSANSKSVRVSNIFPDYKGGRMPEDFVPCPQPGNVTWGNDIMMYSIDGKQYELDTVTLVHRQRK